MPQVKNIQPLEAIVQAPKYETKRWLRMAIDRLRIPNKVFYINLSVDQGSWSRWLSSDHPSGLPLDMVPGVLAEMDDQAFDDLFHLIKALRDQARRPS